MAKQLEVYRDWLGVTEEVRPLNHYQLLRLKMFEDDSAKVREHYRKMNAHVRRFQTGDYAKQSQDLLNELARAMLCLTDTKRKAEYDATLGRKQPRTGKMRTLEEILLGRKILDGPMLDKARQFANAIGVDIHDAVVQKRLAPAEQVMPAYAESIGIPYVDLADIELDLELLHTMPATMARQHSCSPVMIDDNQVLLATPHILDPSVEEELRIRLGHIVRQVLCTPQAIHDVINKHFTKEAAQAEQSAGGAAKVGKAAPPAKAKAATAKAAPTEVAKPGAEAAKPEKGKPAAAKPAVSKDEAAQVRNAAMVAGFATYFVIFFAFMFVSPNSGAIISYGSGFLGAAIVGGLTYMVLRGK